MEKKRGIMEFAGAWKDISEEEAEEMKRSILQLRKQSTKALMKRIKRMNKNTKNQVI